MPASSADWRSVISVLLPAALLVAVAWGALGLLVLHDRDEAVDRAQQQNANLALAFEQHCLATLRSVGQILGLAEAQHRDHGRITAGAPGASLSDDELLLSVSMTDAAGRVVAGTTSVRGADLSGRDFYAHHRAQAGERLFVGAPLPGSRSGRTVIPVSRRVEGPAGFAGVIVAAVNPAYFAEFYRKMDMGDGGMVQLVGLDGSTRARRAGAHTTSGQDNTGGTLLTRQALEPDGSFLSEGRQEGLRRYTSYRTLEDFGLVVAVGASEDDVLAGHLARRNGYVAAAALLAVMVVLFSAHTLLAMVRRRHFLDETLRREAQLTAMFDQAAVGMAHVGMNGIFMKVNDTLCSLTGFARQELLGRRCLDLGHPQDAVRPDDSRLATMDPDSTAPLEAPYVRKDGTAIWAAIAPALVRDPRGRPDYYVAMVQDITESRQARQELLRRSQFDALTALPNRELFTDRLGQALRQARRQRWAACVMFVDVDRFKRVNDAHGHAAGDELLCEIARRLAASVRSVDTPARIGGDEFAVVLAELRQPSDATAVADKILRAVAAPMCLAGREHVVTASIGIALYPDHGEDEESLVRNADAAMFDAKHAGRNAFRIYGQP